MTMSPLRIGTRSSPMALAQTHLVRDRGSWFIRYFDYL